MRSHNARRRARVSAVGVALALSAALVGCSGDGSDADAPDGGGVQTTPGNDVRTTEPEGSTGDSTSESGSPQESASPEESGGGGGYDVNTVDLANQKFELTWQDALDEANGKFDGDVTKVELEVENNVYAYKIELMSDTEKFEYEIDANTGDVLDQETDDLDRDEVKTERKNKAIDLDKVISVEDAMKTALGEQDGRVKEWKIEGKSTGPRYEFDIEKPNSTSDVEIKVDAVSGDVIRTGD